MKSEEPLFTRHARPITGSAGGEAFPVTLC